MNQNPYLIPANTKKGELILGIFRPIDLVIFLVGVGITLLALVIMSLANVRVAFGEVINFYTNRQKYVWRGWCSKYEFKDK